MSFYTQFNNAEAVVTSTTTSILLASDPALIYSANQKHAVQSTVGSVATLWPVKTATVNTTATNLSNYGQTIITSSSSAAYILNDPTVAGLVVSIYNSSTTSTVNSVTGQSATFGTTEAAAAVTLRFSTGAASFELVAASTSAWLCTGRTVAGTSST